MIMFVKNMCGKMKFVLIFRTDFTNEPRTAIRNA